MAKFKVGDVCEIIETYNKYSLYRGMECTVVALAIYEAPEPYYIVQVKGDADYWDIGESCLQLKRPPESSKDTEAFREFMDKLLFPLPVEVLEIA